MSVTTGLRIGDVIRAERAAKAQRQEDLADLLGVTQAFVSQMERGVVDLPGEEVRAKFLEHWGFDPYAARAGERDGKLSLAAATRQLREQGIVITDHGLSQLIATEKVRARRIRRRGLGRYDVGYEIDETELAADIAALPLCAFGGCGAPATSASGCCGSHGQKQWAVEARGAALPTKHRNAISDGKKKAGTKRPDARERMLNWHAELDDEAEQVKAAASEALVDADDIAAMRDTTRHAVISGYRKHGLTPLVVDVGGQRRLFFRLRDVETTPWPARGETGRRAWKHGEGFALIRIAVASGPSRGKWAGTWKLREVRQPQKKGEAAALEAGRRAIEIVAGLNGQRSPEIRRSVFERLMREFEGEESVFNSDGSRRSRRDDPVYRKSRERIRRRLKRATSLLNDSRLEWLL